jgi:hypothetical protein
MLTSFERLILRPLHVGLLIALGLAAVSRHWVSAAGALLAVLYLGTIGAKLHPLQTFSHLASGPTTNPVAALEEEVLSEAEQYHLLGRGCIKLGLCLSWMAFFIARELGWRWYMSVIPSFAVGYGVVALVVAVFGTGRRRSDVKRRQ